MEIIRKTESKHSKMLDLSPTLKFNKMSCSYGFKIDLYDSGSHALLPYSLLI